MAEDQEVNANGHPIHRRDDEIGRLAHLFYGTDGPPDFTVGQPLADEIREQLGDAEANYFIRRVFSCLAAIADRIPEPFTNRRDQVRMIGQFRERLAIDLAAYMLDFTSFCTTAARFVENANRPDKPLQKTRAAIDMVRIVLDRPRGLGQRITMPDGRRGIVVALPDETGAHGLIPIEDVDYDDGEGPIGMAQMSVKGDGD